MNISVFRDNGKLKIRLPRDDKAYVLGELFFALMFLSKDQIIEKLGKERPTLIPTCEITQKEESEIQQINEYLVKFYAD